MRKDLLKDWLLPLAVAALSFGALLAFDPATKPAAATACEEPHHGLTFVFASPASFLRPQPGPIVVLSDAERDLGWETVRTPTCSRSSMTVAQDGSLQPDGPAELACLSCEHRVRWLTPHVGFENGSRIPCDFGLCTFAPHLGRQGYNATRVTVHVFDADGELVFSNGAEGEVAALTKTFAPEPLPGGLWYLGANATTPEGTQRLPPAAGAFVDRLRPLILGLPVGGVASTQTNALVALYGTLFVTLRVDELVHAP